MALWLITYHDVLEINNSLVIYNKFDDYAFAAGCMIYWVLFDFIQCGINQRALVLKSTNIESVITFTMHNFNITVNNYYYIRECIMK